MKPAPFRTAEFEARLEQRAEDASFAERGMRLRNSQGDAGRNREAPIHARLYTLTYVAL